MQTVVHNSDKLYLRTSIDLQQIIAFMKVLVKIPLKRVANGKIDSMS